MMSLNPESVIERLSNRFDEKLVWIPVLQLDISSVIPIWNKIALVLSELEIDIVLDIGSFQYQFVGIDSEALNEAWEYVAGKDSDGNPYNKQYDDSAPSSTHEYRDHQRDSRNQCDNRK